MFKVDSERKYRTVSLEELNSLPADEANASIVHEVYNEGKLFLISTTKDLSPNTSSEVIVKLAANLAKKFTGAMTNLPVVRVTCFSTDNGKVEELGIFTLEGAISRIGGLNFNYKCNEEYITATSLDYKFVYTFTPVIEEE